MDINVAAHNDLPLNCPVFIYTLLKIQLFFILVLDVNFYQTDLKFVSE